jgi:hypothetical protein
MHSQGAVKHFILAFMLALVGYAVFYEGIEHWRARKGPWRVTFTRTAAGAPMILIDHPKLAITNVQVCFAADALPATNRPVTLVFDQPRPVPYAVPFGNCVFMDATFLPGTVTFQLFGHEIELLPRVLVLDRQEHPWRSGTSVTLSPPAPAAPPKANP